MKRTEFYHFNVFINSWTSFNQSLLTEPKCSENLFWKVQELSHLVPQIWHNFGLSLTSQLESTPLIYFTETWIPHSNNRNKSYRRAGHRRFHHNPQRTGHVTCMLIKCWESQLVPWCVNPQEHTENRLRIQVQCRERQKTGCWPQIQYRDSALKSSSQTGTKDSAQSFTGNLRLSSDFIHLLNCCQLHGFSLNGRFFLVIFFQSSTSTIWS